MIYFLTASGIPVIKIGYSGQPDTRWQNISTWSPVPLQLAAVDKRGDELTEAELLRRFAPYRSHGEWFFAVPALVDVVAATAETGDVPGGWYLPKQFTRLGFMRRGPNIPQITRRFSLTRSQLKVIAGSTAVGSSGITYPLASVHIPPLVDWLVRQGHVRDYLEFYSAFSGDIEKAA